MRNFVGGTAVSVCYIVRYSVVHLWCGYADHSVYAVPYCMSISRFQVPGMYVHEGSSVLIFVSSNEDRSMSDRRER